MSETESSSSSWRTPLLLTAGVVMIVIIALLLAQVDAIQRRSLLPSKPLPVVDAEATVVEDLIKVYLPGDSSSTPTPSTTPSPETKTSNQPLATVNASVKPTCTAGQMDWKPYTIQDQESLAVLADRFGISEYDILQANCMAQEKLIAGDQILLPRLVSPKALKGQCYSPPPPGWLQYWIRPGDKLKELADRRGITVDQVISVNCLDGAHVADRHVLLLPPPSTPNSRPRGPTPNVTRPPNPA